MNYMECKQCGWSMDDDDNYCTFCHPEVEMLEKIADSLHKIMRLMEEHYGRKKKE